MAPRSTAPAGWCDGALSRLRRILTEVLDVIEHGAPAETFQFLSPEWLVAVRAVIEDLLDDIDTSGVAFTISEELTDPPSTYARTATGTVGWSLSIRDGGAMIEHRSRDDADLRVIADYATHRDLSRRLWAGDPDAMANSARLRREAIAWGRLRVGGDLSQAPDAVRQLVVTLHDPVALLTR